MLAVDQLPNDPATLKDILVRKLPARDEQLAVRDAAIDQIKREAAERIEAMALTHQAEMAAVLRRLYGPRSERFDPTQLLLFGVRVDSMPAGRAQHRRRGRREAGLPACAAQAWPGPTPSIRRSK